MSVCLWRYHAVAPTFFASRFRTCILTGTFTAFPPLVQFMFKIYKRTMHIGTAENPQQRLDYQLEEKSGSSISNILAIPAMIAGAVVGTLVFSMFFAVLLIPLGIVGFKAWRIMKKAQQQATRQTQGESITAEYTVISDQDKP